jgi:hypothetical protein
MTLHRRRTVISARIRRALRRDGGELDPRRSSGLAIATEDFHMRVEFRDDLTSDEQEIRLTSVQRRRDASLRGSSAGLH